MFPPLKKEKVIATFYLTILNFFHRIAWYTLTIVSYNVRIMIYSHNCETNTRNSDFFLAIQTFFLIILRYKLAIESIYHTKKVYITQ